MFKENTFYKLNKFHTLYDYRNNEFFYLKKDDVTFVIIVVYDDTLVDIHFIHDFKERRIVFSYKENVVLLRSFIEIT